MLDRLDASKLKVIQPERGLGADVFTGDNTALLFVEDLRVGDALEYAHSTRGLNPIIGGHYSTRFSVESSRPVDRQRMRVVWPADQPLHIRQHLADSPPSKVTSNGTTEYTWDFTNLTAVAYEDCLPATFELYPYLELSDFDNWTRVVDWALLLYTLGDTNLPSELQELIRQWRGGTNSAEEAALSALQFVQDDLRYTGPRFPRLILPCWFSTPSSSWWMNLLGTESRLWRRKRMPRPHEIYSGLFWLR